ncbi:MAG TPA: glucose-6-phosphate dehydrogenase [Candidatus Binataceae bacterium]|nr:glucose-6-phosphate dehydrogenase [Candidatus Binataceae bacterium]
MEQTLHIATAQPAQPCTVVVFGASGDLAKRKLIPALYNLRASDGAKSPHDFAVVGFARREIALDKFRGDAREWAKRFSRVEIEARSWDEFAANLDYVSGLDQADGFQRLKERLEQLEAKRGLPPNRIYYLSVPPEAVRECIERLGAAGLIAKAGAENFTRVVLEKPIGHDLESALAINHELHAHFDESQIFRIDHYLGKETVQNLLALRFANAIFEGMWGARNIDHVQITVAESEGVGARAMYYDPAGALRDMVQNHIMQLLALIAMDPPVALDAGAIRDAKLNVLRAIRPLAPGGARDLVVRGRYTDGLAEGKVVPGYLKESGIPADSQTETFVAIKLFIDNWRWAGAPFYLRTGKRMPARESLIYVQFKNTPRILFNRNAQLPPNALTIRIQPDEGFSFEVLAKQPGLDVVLRPVRMNLRYQSEFSGQSPEAYERLLLEVMAGDHTLFVSADFVEKSWQFVQSILDQWQADRSIPIQDYPAGSFGPAAADVMIGKDGRAWRNTSADAAPRL